MRSRRPRSSYKTKSTCSRTKPSLPRKPRRCSCRTRVRRSKPIWMKLRHHRRWWGGRSSSTARRGNGCSAIPTRRSSPDTDFIPLCDEILIGWIKFNGKGEQPDRIQGLLYDGFIMPP